MIRLDDEDNQMTMVCDIYPSERRRIITIGEVVGYHVGLVHDVPSIDADMLRHDADMRLGRSEGCPIWGVFHTRIDCMYVVSAMLRTHYLAYRVNIDSSGIRHLRRPLQLGLLDMHVSELQKER